MPLHTHFVCSFKLAKGLKHFCLVKLNVVKFRIKLALSVHTLRVLLVDAKLVVDEVEKSIRRRFDLRCDLLNVGANCF